MYLYLSSAVSVRVRFLWVRPNTEILWMKRQVPKDLVPLVGKACIMLSLGTRDKRQAAKLIDQHARAQDKEWAELRNPTKAGSLEQATRFLQDGGIDPADPKATPEALDVFYDIVEGELPDGVRQQHWEASEMGIPVTNKDIDPHLSPVTRAALQIVQGRVQHLASDCEREYLSGRSPRSTKSVVVAFRVLRQVCKDRHLTEYRRSDVRKLVQHWSDEGCSRTTIERYVGALRTAFNRSIREYELDCGNVWEGTLEFPKDTKPATKRQGFTVDDYKVLRDSIGPIDEADDLRCLLALIEATGARLSEVAGLKVSDCHPKAETPHIVLENHSSRGLKTEYSVRKVPLTGRGLQAVQRILKVHAGGGYCFPRYASDEGTKGGSASAALCKWLKARDLPTPHGLRHGATSLLRAVQAPNSVMDSLLGWSGEGMRSRYGDPEPLPVCVSTRFDGCASTVIDGRLRHRPSPMLRAVGQR